MTETSTSIFEINKNQIRNLGTQSEVIEKILQVLMEHIETENKDLDSTDRILDTIHDIADSVQEEFEELIDIDSDKKTFIRNLSKLFTILHHPIQTIILPKKLKRELQKSP